MSRESFLKRWARRKQEATDGVSTETGLIETGQIEPEPIEADVPPQLPPVETLDSDSDYSGFMHSKVDPETRNAALKKLFASPHYQVSDGLDVYIGDYSAPAELPAAMLAGLAHARTLLASDNPKKEQAEPAELRAAREPAPVQTATLDQTAASAARTTADGEKPVSPPPSPDERA